MDTQRVEVLHVTYGDTVVVTVAHHLVLYLLPTLQGLLYQHLWRERECLLSQGVQLFLIITEARAQATQCIGSTQDDRITQFGSSLTGISDIITSLTLDGLHANLVEFPDKQFTVLSIHDSLHGRTQHFHTIFLQHATLIEFHTAVQRRLSTKGQEDAVWTFLLDDPLHEIRLHGQEVDLIGYTLGGLHRSDIRIDKHRLDALLAECLQGLTAAIVKFACLTDFQGTTTQQQDFLYSIIFHNVSIKRSNINSVSTGPEQASGWNWLENQGCDR